MSVLHHIREKLGELAHRFHREQGGAIAIMVLAALLVIFMISLVIYDTGKVARSKLEVQAAAETAAWSHTAVEARSMNTIAFANIGKKLIVGMNAYYDAVFKAYLILAGIIVAVIIVCGLALLLAGAGAACLKPAVKMGLNLADIMLGEAEDLGKFFGGNDLKKFFKDDLKAFDGYQTYMAKITPWWAWMEGFLRGARNGASAIGTFPVPRNMTNELLGSLGLGSLPIPAPTNIVDKLPAARASSSAGPNQLCDRLWSEGDIIINALDYTIKSLIQNTKGYQPIIVILTALIAMPLTPSSCRSFYGGRYGDEALPFEIPNPGSPARWQLQASNLVFAYRPNPDLSDVDEKKFGFMRNDYSGRFAVQAAGSWAMARAEIAFQDDEAPDLWHTNWSSRMRPVALGSEWADANVKFSGAAMDAIPFLAAGRLLSGVASGSFQFNVQDMLYDGARVLFSADALNDNSTGLGR